MKSEIGQPSDLSALLVLLIERTVKGTIIKTVQVLMFCFFLGQVCTAASAEVLNIPQHIWDGLQIQQRTLIGERFVVNVREGNGYGVIIDAQSLNESTPGSNAGSKLGAAIGSSTYVDNAFSGSPRNWNYSATGHLTAQLAGALIGSLANQQAQARFRTRYTIKNGNGGVEYVEEIKSDAFRHTVGLCVSLGPIRPIEVDTCSVTNEQFLAKYSWLGNTVQQVAPFSTPQINAGLASANELQAQSQVNQTESANEKIYCRFGMATPVRVTVSVCESASGTVISQ